MYNANANRITASKLIQRAEEIADITNTDFLSYNEKLEYLNSTWKDVYQKIINYDLNVFTVDANLVGAAGRYKLPFDCYQIKSVKNPYTGRMIPRKADSESALGGYYEIVNDEIVLGPTVGPVVVTYWRKPFWLSVPNKTIKSELESKTVLDTCNNSLLVVDSDNKLYVQNILTDSELELPYTKETEYGYKLGNNFIIKYKNDTVIAYDFYGNMLDEITSITYSYGFVKADNGLYYFSKANAEDENIWDIYELFGDKIAEVQVDENTESIIGIDDNFYSIETEDAFPIGVFDDRPAYITNDKKLHLINPDGSEIVEKVDVPSIGPLVMIKYGFVTFENKVYSCIPDTLLDFPNNLYYDVISYDLAVRFMCKQNADSSGVENLNANAWRLLVNSIDQNADYPRVKLVRR